jgi:hypothetical protein
VVPGEQGPEKVNNGPTWLVRLRLQNPCVASWAKNPSFSPIAAAGEGFNCAESNRLAEEELDPTEVDPTIEATPGDRERALA